MVELCVECKGPASSRCLRCAGPVCEAHDGGAENRCVNCESEYVYKAHRLSNRVSIVALVVTVMSLMVLAAAGAAFSGSLSYPAALKWLLAAPFAAWGVRALAPPLTRRLFLTQRTPAAKALAGAKTTTKLLPERTASSDDTGA